MDREPTYQELREKVAELSNETQQRKLAEAALRQTEAMARALLNASADSAVLLDAKGSILAINEIGVQMLGKSNVNVIRLNFFDLLPPHVAKERKARAEEVIGTGEPIHFEDQLWGRVINNTIYPVFNQGGKVEKLAVYARDITDQRRAEEALQESMEKFRSISIAAQDALIMMDSQGNVSFWNEAAERIFGYKKREIIGEELHQILVPQRYRDNFDQAFERFKMTGHGPAIGKTLELYALRKSGLEFPIELSLSALQLKGEWHALGIIRDISDRKLAENERAHKQKLQGVLEMAGAASHELNQPLQVISGYVDLLLKNITPEHPHYDFIKEIKGQIVRLGKVTKKIMRITKYETVDYIKGVKIIDIDKASKSH